MFKIYYNLCILLTISASLLVSNSHAQSSSSTTERYITIDNADSFFVKKDDYINVDSFVLKNIYQNESSKTVFIAVNEIEGVVKFSIKSNSEQIINQRSCYLIMNKEKYLDTFANVLKQMKIKYIEHKDKLFKVEDFYNSILLKQ